MFEEHKRCIQILLETSENVIFPLTINNIEFGKQRFCEEIAADNGISDVQKKFIVETYLVFLYFVS